MERWVRLQNTGKGQAYFTPLKRSDGGEGGAINHSFPAKNAGTEKKNPIICNKEVSNSDCELVQNKQFLKVPI